MAESFEQFMVNRNQQPLQNKRIPPTQGTPENPQNPEPPRANTGIGAAIGSLLGTGVAVVPSAVLASRSPVAGAALAEGIIGTGAGVGSLGESIAQRVRHGESPIPDQADLDTAKTEAGLSVLFGAGIRTGLGAYTKGRRYFQESVTPEAKDAINFLRQYRPDEQFMTAAEMTENRLLDITSNFAEHSVWGGGDVRAFKLHRDEEVAGIAEDIAGRIAAHKDTINIGKMALAIRNRGNQLGKVPATNLYKMVEEESRNLFVSTDSLKAFTQDAAATNKEILGFGQELTGHGLAEIIQKFKGTMSVRDMMAFQRAIRAKVRNLKDNVETKNAPAIQFYSTLNEHVDGIVREGLSQPGAPAELLQNKLLADKLWKSNKDTFSNDVINSLVKKVSKNPAGITKHILIADHKGSEELIKAFKATQPPEAWKVVQRGAIETLYAASTTKQALTHAGSSQPVHGTMKGASLLNLIVGKNGIGERAAKELWGKDGAQTMIRFAKSLATLQEKNPVTEGSLAIQFTQMGAALAVASGSFRKEAAGLLIGPKLLAKAILNPKFTDALLEGAAMARSDPKWGALSLRIAGLVGVAELQRQQDEDTRSLKAIIRSSGLPILEKTSLP